MYLLHIKLASFLLLLVKSNIACLYETKILISTKNRFLLVNNQNDTHQGCYLYYDTNNEIWILSRKVTGKNDRGFKT